MVIILILQGVTLLVKMAGREHQTTIKSLDEEVAAVSFSYYFIIKIVTAIYNKSLKFGNIVS